MKKRTFLCIGVVAIMLFCLTAGAFAMTNGKTLWFQSESGYSHEYKHYNEDKALEWGEIIAYNQIPDEELKEMSTKSLVETCLNYPLFASGMVFSNVSMYDGFQNTRNQFNGLNELFKRTDAGSELVSVYQSVNSKDVLENDPYPTLRVKYLEYILAQDEILQTLTKDEKEKLCTFCLEKLEKQYSDEKQPFYIDSTILVLARIYAIDSADFMKLVESSPNLGMFLKNGVLEEVSEENIALLRDFFEKQLEGGK